MYPVRLNISPFQSAQFAYPHSCAEQKQDSSAGCGIGNHLFQGILFIVTQEPDFGFLVLGYRLILFLLDTKYDTIV